MKKIIIILLFFPVFVLGQEKININTATLEQLDILAGIGPAYAQRIIDNRPFFSIDDLLKVSGIGEKTLEKIKEQKLAYVEEKPVETTPMPTTEPMNEVEPPSYVDIEEIEIKVEDGPRAFPSGIVINEILPSPEGSDSENEWIELYNQNDFEVDLNNWVIKDTTGSIKEHILETKITGLGYLLLKRPETKITLNNDNDGLILMNPNKEIADSVSFGKALQGQSYNRSSSEWSWTTTLTPGEQNVIVKKSAPQPKQTNLTGSKNQESAEARPPQILRNKLVDGFEDPPGISVFLIGFIVALFSSIAFLIIKSNIKGFWY